MIFKKTLLGLAAAGTILGSTAAQAAPAPVRSSAITSESEELGGVGRYGAASYGWILLAAIAAGVVAIVVTDDDDQPESP